VVDLSEQGRIYLQNVAENDRKATDINMQMAILDQVERYVQSNRRTGIVPTTLGIEDPVLVDLLQRLNQLELEYTNLRTTVPENNAEARSLENEIQEIRPNILNIVQNQRSRLSASRNNLAGSTGRYSNMIRSIPQQERELVEISRQQAIKNDVYAFLQQRREEAAVSSAATLADSRVVDRAEASIYPVASGKLVALAAAFAAAIAIGILYVLLKESWSSKILFRSRLEESTPFPVIGEITNRRYRKNVLRATASDALLAKEIGQIQASLGLFTTTNSYKRFLVTSSLPKEGKTFLSNLFAIHLAAAEKKVILIDLNLYDSKISALHDRPDVQGFSDYVEGSLDVRAIVHPTGFANLDLIAAGTKLDKPMGLLLHPKAASLFQHLEHAYDYIIINSPPVEFTTDAYALAKYCDITLYMVRHGVTPKSSLIKLGENGAMKTFPNLSLIFNGVKPRGFLQRYFGYGYGYGFEKVFNKKYYHKPVVK
jgi:capsular exopolysaccharide synthesis family protein